MQATDARLALFWIVLIHVLFGWSFYVYPQVMQFWYISGPILGFVSNYLVAVTVDKERREFRMFLPVLVFASLLIHGIMLGIDRGIEAALAFGAALVVFTVLGVVRGMRAFENELDADEPAVIR